MEEKRDVAILGLWWSCNYGSLMTYYSLYRVIQGLGYSVTMIDRPGFAPDNPLFHTHGRRFAKENYEAITPVFGFREMRKLNAYADSFVIGSDQVWNFGISKPYQGAFFLNFLEDQKRRLSYAASFGHAGFYAPEQERLIAKGHLEKFDAISVREKDAIKITKDTFGLKATRVLDPVFLAAPEIFDELIEKSAAKNQPLAKEPFIATYFLDPSPAKRKVLQGLAGALDLPSVHLLDGYLEHFEKNKEALNLENTAENLQVEDWLYYIKNCHYLVTDSCHGASFAILFQKPFICIANESRGMSRFQSLGKLFGLEKRFMTEQEALQRRKKLLQPIDYAAVNKILKHERKVSTEWLAKALAMPVLKEKNNQYSEGKSGWQKLKKKLNQLRNRGRNV